MLASAVQKQLANAVLGVYHIDVVAVYVRRSAMAVNDRNVRVLAHMLLQCLAIINIADHIAIGENHIFLKGIFQEAANGIERFDLAVGSRSRFAERRQQVQTLALSRKVPGLAGAEVVHQGLVVGLCDDTNLINA